MYQPVFEKPQRVGAYITTINKIFVRELNTLETLLLEKLITKMRIADLRNIIDSDTKCAMCAQEIINNITNHIWQEYLPFKAVIKRCKEMNE